MHTWIHKYFQLLCKLSHEFSRAIQFIYHWNRVHYNIGRSIFLKPRLRATKFNGSFPRTNICISLFCRELSRRTRYSSEQSNNIFFPTNYIETYTSRMFLKNDTGYLSRPIRHYFHLRMTFFLKQKLFIIFIRLSSQQILPSTRIWVKMYCFSVMPSHAL